MRKLYRAIFIGALLIILSATAILALDPTWDEAGVSINLSQSGDAKPPTLALGPDGEVAVAWGGNGEKHIFLARHDGENWNTTVLTPTEETDTWNPNLVYTGTQLLAAWMQTGATGNDVMQYDVDIGMSPQRIITSVYGIIFPRMAVNTEGIHMIFAATHDPNMSSKGDLYYTYRAAGTSTWITPTVVITHAQASAPNDGGIRFPTLALSPDGQSLHIVWEQIIALAEDPYIQYTVWYVSGTWNFGEQQFHFGSPMQLSEAARNAVLPAIAVDEADRVHVTWIELYGGSVTHPEGQYVNYRRLASSQWTPAIRVDPVHVIINGTKPTWSMAAVDTRGDTLCVTWHGYRGNLGDSGKEEVLLRCSRNGGQSWDPMTVNVSNTPDRFSFCPDIHMDETGRIHIVWQEHQGGPDLNTNYDAYYRVGTLPHIRIYLPLVLRTS
jgi:hypothetical protein